MPRTSLLALKALRRISNAGKVAIYRCQPNLSGLRIGGIGEEIQGVEGSPIGALSELALTAIWYLACLRNLPEVVYSGALSRPIYDIYVAPKGEVYGVEETGDIVDSIDVDMAWSNDGITAKHWRI